jgi:hypothetical protein
MRKPLTDSLCAELAKDFKPFKVRRNGLKPLNGFKTSTTYTVTELRMNAFKQWVVSFNSDSCWLAENFDMIVEKQAEPKRMVKGICERGWTEQGEFSHIDEDGFTHIKYFDTTVKLVAIESDPIQVKAQQIDEKLKAIDWSKDQHMVVGIDLKRTEPNPDNDTIKQLVQYVSEHRDSMSKESLMHFSSLIGLIKLGAL